MKTTLYWGLVTLLILLIIGFVFLLTKQRSDLAELRQQAANSDKTDLKDRNDQQTILSNSPLPNVVNGHWHNGVWCSEDHENLDESNITKSGKLDDTADKISGIAIQSSLEWMTPELRDLYETERWMDNPNIREDYKIAYSPQAHEDRWQILEYFRIEDEYHAEYEKLNKESEKLSDELTDIALTDEQVSRLSTNERSDYVQRLDDWQVKHDNYMRRREDHNRWDRLPYPADAIKRHLERINLIKEYNKNNPTK